MADLLKKVNFFTKKIRNEKKGKFFLEKLL